ncbi:endo-1,4-beta-xylanase [Microbacterium ulmi]|uniref:Beta-xylanase n=1 Tax=Microbacterium ulmi TaxID=179095 RepID=A0A7Y2M1C3_9MICO|nr:endo-1,4-beta-xylanase [Microbacterium ulmi]NII69004.1 GH35 family endo-1,4-beta-xylanase [Microbacterium ulmi]NNH03984.1 1,4-beta-xylanase [Microbacterium ulmi]
MSRPDLSHRFLDVALRVVAADGTPVTTGPIVVEQTGHAFGFGNIGFDFVGLLGGEAGLLSGEGGSLGGEDAAAAPDGGSSRLLEQWTDVFNAATLPFYWRRFEPRRGEPDTERLLVTARWFRDRGVTVKGHPLVWHTLAPEWLLQLSDADVEAALRDRITRDVTAFAGVVDLWDAINEVVILPVFTAEENAVTRLAQKRGRVEMVRLAFETAREANPAARLVLNDFDLSPDYERLIEDVLDAGIRLDAIGLQTHMHQGYRGEEQVWGILERFARFGLPLQLTETTLVSGEIMPAHIVDLNDYVVDSWPSTPEGEARQADELLRHYRLLLSHPAVESATYWGLTDAGAWLGAPAGLVRADGTPKPSYDALRAAVKGQWWHEPRSYRPGADGSVRVRGFAGDYRVTTPAGAATFRVEPGVRDVRARLTP